MPDWPKRLHLADGGQLTVSQSRDCGESLNWPVNEGFLPAEVVGPNPHDLGLPWWCLAVPGSCRACRLRRSCQLPPLACCWPLGAPARLIRHAAAGVRRAEPLHRGNEALVCTQCTGKVADCRG